MTVREDVSRQVHKIIMALVTLIQRKILPLVGARTTVRNRVLWTHPIIAPTPNTSPELNLSVLAVF